MVGSAGASRERMEARSGCVAEAADDACACVEDCRCAALLAEAPVVLVSMAASSAGDSPRGTDFLLSPNRLNVALSRGMWAAVVVCSTRFTDFLPTSPEALALLGAFIRLERAALPFPDEGEAGVRPDTPTVRS